jgi:hypothetical protein
MNMKKTKALPPILAAVMATGCAPLEPVEPVVQDDDDDEICRMEASLGTHIKEVVCKPSDDSQVMSDVDDERDVNGIFGDITVEQRDNRTPPEAKCGGAQD